LAEFEVATEQKEEKKTHSIARLTVLLDDPTNYWSPQTYSNFLYFACLSLNPHSFKTQINRCKAPNKKLGNQNQKKREKERKNEKKLEIISTWKRLSLDTYECRPFLIFKPLTKFAVEEALTQKQSTFSLIDDKFFGKPR